MAASQVRIIVDRSLCFCIVRQGSGVLWLAPMASRRHLHPACVARAQRKGGHATGPLVQSDTPSSLTIRMLCAAADQTDPTGDGAEGSLGGGAYADVALPCRVEL